VHANKIQKQVVEEEYEVHDNCDPYKQAFLKLEIIALFNHVQIQENNKMKGKKKSQGSNDIGNEVRSIKKPK
jgi:hypothetical protein